MAANRRTRILMPTTLHHNPNPPPLPQLTPAPDPINPPVRKRVSRVTTSDASAYNRLLENVSKKRKVVLEYPFTLPPEKRHPHPPIPRPDAGVLESEMRREIERRQFQPLTEEWFWRVLQQMYKTDEKKWTEWAIDMDRMKILRSDYRFLITLLYRDPDQKLNYIEMAHVQPTLVDLYVYLICEYRNQAIARTLKGGDLAGNTPTKQKLSCICIDTQRLYWEPKKGDLDRQWAWDPEQRKRVSYVRWTEQDFALSWSMMQKALEPYDEETFMNLDYVFLIFEYAAHHLILMGIAPKQRFCFHIDNASSMSTRRIPEEDKRMSRHMLGINTYCMNLLEAVVLDRFGEGYYDSERLPLYGQWHYRTDHRMKEYRTTDNSPNAPRQADDYNCGMMAMTNAVNLAFGYDMSCFSCNDNNNDINTGVPPRVGKRWRVAAELLNGGFSPPFDYPLFKIPTKLQELAIDPSFTHNIRPSPEKAPEKEEEEEEEEESDEEESNEEGEEEQSEDGQGAQGGGQAGARTKVKNVKKARKVKWSGQPVSDPDFFGPEPSGTSSTVDEEPIRTLWPAQMDPTVTGRCGFKYPIKHRFFSGPRYNDRFQCKYAAEHFGMDGWELWEKMPLHLFRAWMENRMTGISDDEETPWYDCLADSMLETKSKEAVTSEFHAPVVHEIY